MLTIPELLFVAGYGLLVHNPTHATIHVLTAKHVVKEARLTNFNPYPGVYHGRFAMDNSDLEIRGSLEDLKRADKQLTDTAYTPQAFNGMLFAATSVGTQFVENRKLKRYMMLAGLFVPLVDATVNYGVSIIDNRPDDYERFNAQQKTVIGLAISAAWAYAVYSWNKNNED